MEELVVLALGFPCVVYTVLLGAALVYWIFVIVGAASVDLLGEGAADGALDGLDGHALGDGGAGGHDGFDIDHGGHGLDHGGHGHEGHAHGGVLSGVLSALKLRSAPVTVVLSVFFLFSWLFSTMGMQLAHAWLPSSAHVFAQFGLFLLAPLLALPFTSVAVRPLARLFVPASAKARRDLVGKVCTIRTGTVTETFGEAMLEDGGAGLVLRVRVDGEEALRRGDRAIVVSYDEETHEFTVTKADAALDESPRRMAR